MSHAIILIKWLMLNLSTVDPLTISLLIKWNYFQLLIYVLNFTSQNKLPLWCFGPHVISRFIEAWSIHSLPFFRQNNVYISLVVRYCQFPEMNTLLPTGNSCDYLQCSLRWLHWRHRQSSSSYSDGKSMLLIVLWC